MKYWIKKLFNLVEASEREVGYTLGYDAGITDGKRLMEPLIQRRAINMFCESGYPNPLNVFDISPSGIAYLNKEPLNKEKAFQLKQEAGLLKSMDIWDVIQETIKKEALVKGITHSKNWEEVLAGKMMLHNLGIIKSIIDKIQNIDVDKSKGKDFDI